MSASRLTQRVWDPLVRLVHWTLALSILVAWLTRSGGGRWHEWVGYAALVLVAVRVAWGAIGTRYARFTQFVRGPRATLSYGARFARARAPRYVGHNPLGGWMTVALLSAIALTGFTGWLYTTPDYWGVEWVEEIHEAFAIAVLVLVALHVTGVIASSISHRENLVASMVHGRKRGPSPDDIV